MLLTRFTQSLRRQDWATVLLELVVLVVGILLALQVDNWNERRIELRQEKALLESLYSDFQENSQIAVDRHEQYHQAEVAALKLFEISAGNDGRGANAIYSLIDQAVFIRPPGFNSNTWDLLTASGQLTIIRNGDLKKQISAFYRLTSAYSNSLEKLVNERSDALSRYVATYLDVPRYINTIHPEDLDFLEFGDEEQIVLNESARTELKNLSIEVWHVARDFRGNMNRTQEILNEIRGSLSEELKRFES